MTIFCIKMKIRAGGGSFRAGGGSFRAAGCSPLLFLFMGNINIDCQGMSSTMYSILINLRGKNIV